MTEREKAIAFNLEIQSALLTVFQALNQGQQQKLLKDETVRVVFDRYGIGADSDG